MSDLIDKPLVTFALFAYNQEKYIREAVEGAFSQTYGPMEIILSDDCSTDRTFEIMQEMATEYSGTHKVIVRRNIMNLGTAMHVYCAFIESKGDLFIVAAGDDISFPDRALTLFDTWNLAGRPSGVVHSGWETFRHSQDKITGRYKAKQPKKNKSALEGYAESNWLPAAAPTAAYTRDVFEKFGPLFGGSIIEDAPLFLRAALVGDFIFCDNILVRQRHHDSNAGFGYTLSRPSQWNRFIQSKFIAFRNMQSDLIKWTGLIDLRLKVQIENNLLAVLRSITLLALPETKPLNLLEKSVLAFRLMFSPAISHIFRHRLEHTLNFFGFEFHNKLKQKLLIFQKLK